MKEPVWVLREVVLASHEQSLAQFGGPAGLRDEALLDSTLGRPLHRFHYGKPGMFDLAASYGHGLVKSDTFIDGNKRTGFLVAVVFLELNGFRFRAGEVDATLQTLALAAGDLSEVAFAKWLKAHSKKA